MENTFKGSVFGGFNRDDVIRYIEKTSLETKQQIEQLEQENNGLCRESASLRDELAAAQSAREQLAGSYSAALEMQVSLKKELAAAQEALAALRTQHEASAKELDDLRARSSRELGELKERAERELREAHEQSAQQLDAAKADCARRLAEQQRQSDQALAEAHAARCRLEDELSALRPQAEEFARVKAHIADIELSARERADALDTATRTRLQELIDACTKQCELVIATLGTTCANVSGELRRTDAMVSQLPAAFNTLRTDLKELQKLVNEQ